MCTEALIFVISFLLAFGRGGRRERARDIEIYTPIPRAKKASVMNTGRPAILGLLLHKLRQVTDALLKHNKGEVKKQAR